MTDMLHFKGIACSHTVKARPCKVSDSAFRSALKSLITTSSGRIYDMAYIFCSECDSALRLLCGLCRLFSLAFGQIEGRRMLSAVQGLSEQAEAHISSTAYMQKLSARPTIPQLNKVLRMAPMASHYCSILQLYLGAGT